MKSYQSSIEIDFGKVGYWNDLQPFRVRLSSAPLQQLIRSAEQAHRVYELLLIDRVGDVWNYVSVTLKDSPKCVRDRLFCARQCDKIPEDKLSKNQLPFTVFDSLFNWNYEDTDPVDEVWLNHRDSTAMKSFARHLLAVVKSAQSRLSWGDDLLRHITDSVHRGEHAFCCLDRSVAVNRSRRCPPEHPAHTDEFYKKLSDIIRRDDVDSVAYRGSGDYHTLRIMATEQRRRSLCTGHSIGNALHLGALVNRMIDNESWGSEVRFFCEGLSYGDLFINEFNFAGASIKALVEKHRILHGKYILCTLDKTDSEVATIDGYEMERGVGWLLYQKLQPHGRRMSLALNACRRLQKMRPVIRFTELGQVLFDYEKTVVVVGAGVAVDCCAVLAKIISEWQASGSEPLLVVEGDGSEFFKAGCINVITVPQEKVSEDNLIHWFTDVLKNKQPWIDAVVALNAPAWATQAIKCRITNRYGLWKPWILATLDEKQLDVDMMLEGDLAALFSEASARAKK